MEMYRAHICNVQIAAELCIHGTEITKGLDGHHVMFNYCAGFSKCIGPSMLPKGPPSRLSICDQTKDHEVQGPQYITSTRCSRHLKRWWLVNSHRHLRWIVEGKWAVKLRCVAWKSNTVSWIRYSTGYDIKLSFSTVVFEVLNMHDLVLAFRGFNQFSEEHCGNWQDDAESSCPEECLDGILFCNSCYHFLVELQQWEYRGRY